MPKRICTKIEEKSTTAKAKEKKRGKCEENKVINVQNKRYVVQLNLMLYNSHNMSEVFHLVLLHFFSSLLYL